MLSGVKFVGGGVGSKDIIAIVSWINRKSIWERLRRAFFFEIRARRGVRVGEGRSFIY